MKHTGVSLCIAILLMVLPVSSNAAPQTSVSGWERYLFNMTPQQARSVPGLKWSALKTVNIPEEPTLSGMTALSPVARYGHEFQVDLVFQPVGKLKEIALTTTDHDTIAQKPLAECIAGFESLLRSFENQYGAFVAVEAAHPLDNSGIGPYWIELRPVEGSASQYSFTTLQSTITNYYAKARTSFGPPGLQLGMSWGDNSCGLTVRFTRDQYYTGG